RTRARSAAAAADGDGAPAGQHPGLARNRDPGARRPDRPALSGAVPKGRRAVAERAAGHMMFRLMTYNIRHGGRGREAAIAAVVSACAPDLVLLQEATDPRSVERIAHGAGMEEWRAYAGQSLGFLSRR